MKKFIKKVLARHQRNQALKAKNLRELNNRKQRDLILKGLEERGY